MTKLVANVICSHYFSFYSIVTPRCVVKQKKRKGNVNTFTILDHGVFHIFSKYILYVILLYTPGFRALILCSRSLRAAGAKRGRCAQRGRCVKSVPQMLWYILYIIILYTPGFRTLILGSRSLRAAGVGALNQCSKSWGIYYILSYLIPQDLGH